MLMTNTHKKDAKPNSNRWKHCRQHVEDCWQKSCLCLRFLTFPSLTWHSELWSLHRSRQKILLLRSFLIIQCLDGWLSSRSDLRQPLPGNCHPQHLRWWGYFFGTKSGSPATVPKGILEPKSPSYYMCWAVGSRESALVLVGFWPRVDKYK